MSDAFYSPQAKAYLATFFAKHMASDAIVKESIALHVNFLSYRCNVLPLKLWHG